MCLALLVAASTGTPAAAPPDPKAEYFERLAKVPPRSADAHVELAEWCRKAGLEEYASDCYLRALEIDSDCAAARAALGYERYGAGWIKSAEKRNIAKRPPPPEGRAESPPAEGGTSKEGSGTPEGTPVEASKEPDEPSAKATGPGAETVQKSGSQETPDVRKVERKGTAGDEAASAEVERKKEWAKAAGEKIAVNFFTYEDPDFLIHTTLPTTSREFKALLGNLKAHKKTLVGLTGVGASTRIWPDKLQFFLPKSVPEFERFADMVDNLKTPQVPEGAYTLGDHTVVLKTDSELLPRVLGESALAKLNGSDRYIGKWLREGIGEWLSTQSASGLAKKQYQTAMTYAAEVIKGEEQALKVFDIIEAADFKTQELKRNRALSMSLVDFLFKAHRRGLSELIRALKSDAAPAPPATDAEFKAFHLTYISFQEEAIKSAFRWSLDVLDEKWKLYVISTAESFKKKEAPKEDTTKKKRTR